MNETFLHKKIRDSLADVNNAVNFFLFVREEYESAKADLSQKAQSLMVTDLYQSNKHSKNVNVSINKLKEYTDSASLVNFSAIISSAYEFISIYEKEIINFLVSSSKTSFQKKQDNDKTPEGTLWLSLESHLGVSLDANLKLSLTYFRHRRNHYTHMISPIDTRLQNIIDNEGSNLTSFWGSKGINFDFSSKDVGYFYEHELYPALGILRECLEYMDSIVSPLVDDIKAAVEFYFDSYKTNTTNLDTIRRRCQSCINPLKDRYGVLVNRKDMVDEVRRRIIASATVQEIAP